MMLFEELIEIEKDYSDAEDCIRKMGEILIANHFVKENYIEDVIRREEQYPTGLPGKKYNIAIPHSDHNTILKSAIGVCIPKEPIKFKAMDNINVDINCSIILFITIKDSSKQIKILKKIVDLIQNEHLLEYLITSKDKDVVIKELSQYF